MPCPPELMKRAEDMVDNILSERKDEIRANYFAQQDIDGKTLPLQYRHQQDQEERISAVWGPRPPKPPVLSSIYNGAHNMSDATSERNDQVKAAMRQTGTAPPLNTGPAQIPCGTKLAAAPSDQQDMWKLVQAKRADAPLD
jgi:hypothetical protein